MEKNKEKRLGQINTPTRLVEQMLDLGGYFGNKILRKHVLDNSCGNGQFLSAIVERYIKESLASGNSASSIATELSRYIHGIEVDENICELCAERMSSIAEKFGIDDVQWNIVCADSLLYHEFDGEMDYVFGNPPYVRVHNVKGDDGYDIMKSYKFAEKGSSDLYLAFYERGLAELCEGGILCYITPSSWLSSVSGRNMREYILENRTLSAVVDFGHKQVFDNAQTYTIVTLFKNKECKEISCHDNNFQPVSSVTYSNISINGKFYFADEKSFDMLKKIESTEIDRIRVKNGLATLADKVFIDELPDNIELSIEVIKGSTGQWHRCLFPYTSDGERGVAPYSLNEIETYFPETYRYIIANETALKDRTYDNGSNWWEIGRSQGLPDTFEYKISLSSLISKPGDIKMTEIKPGQHVYSGYYVTGYKSFEEIKNALDSKDFFEYVKLLKKYKSGNYYTFSSKDVEKFLNYWLYGKK